MIYLLNMLFLTFIFLGCFTYDPPKETVLIINNSNDDTVYVFSGHCIERLDSIPTPRKYYYDSGYNSMVRNHMFIDPLDSQKLALGYTLLPIINSCDDKKQKYLL
jgi:hypothetical protein